MPALTFRRVTSTAICAAAALMLGTTSASADTDMGQKPPPSDSKPSNEIGSLVQFKASRPGSGGRPMTPVAGNWNPPACWYEPKYTPKELQDYLASHDYGSGSAGNGMSEEYGKDNFHKGDKGAWYELVKSGDASLEEFAERCASLDVYQWIGPADPAPPGTPVVDPQVLAGLAYDRTRLPAPPMKLSPSAENQVVNLETYASFTEELDRVWVTASLNHMDVNVAATTVATPVELHIEAGTEYANPQSCTYDLVRKGGGYSVNTRESDCNITYRKSSGDGTYKLQASITWKVTWTDSTDPDGPAQQPPLPNGESTNQQDVTVKEVQAINR
ncbi:hypothetical protein [Streptomyces sp. NPDC047108]|uniref:hypothetical protein n=1 Tax=Streptomyces sp. NPDC047108 TaxID=3155025 RepID=UPI0033F0421A